jgi:lipopolysaccharide export system protein LptA
MKIRTASFWRRQAAAIAMLLVIAACGEVAAQTTHSTPSAFSGFSQNKKDPIKIESLSLEVRDKEKIATFIDNVRLVQGDMTLECKRLTVFYDDEITPGGSTAKKGKSGSDPGAGSGGQQVRRLEAKGGVVVTQKDQTATGDNGVYDMKTNSIVLTGNVVMAQGPNVVKGEKLVVDMTTGISRVESGSSGQITPVRALFNPGSAREAVKPGGTAAAGDQAASGGAKTSSDRTGAASPERTTSSSPEKERTKQGASRPLKLN